MKIHQLTTEEAFRSLQSGREGLALGEAQRRLAEYGPNEVEQIQREPLVLRFVKEFSHFFATPEAVATRDEGRAGRRVALRARR
jgi:hypothetical protein